MRAALEFAAVTAVAWAGVAWAQAPAPIPGGIQTTAITKKEVSSYWSSLNSSQQQSLKPLSGMWESMDGAQQRKWLALAQTYPNLAPAEQEKLRSRMVEWAALSPKDRTAARLNFMQTKSVDKAERVANWEAYQALPEDEKKKLAATAPAKPKGAAPAIKPVPPQKLTPVPVTRNTPPEQRSAAVAQTQLNRNTLLPEQASDTNAPAADNDSNKP